MSARHGWSWLVVALCLGWSAAAHAEVRAAVQPLGGAGRKVEADVKSQLAKLGVRPVDGKLALRKLGHAPRSGADYARLKALLHADAWVAIHPAGKGNFLVDVVSTEGGTPVAHFAYRPRVGKARAASLKGLQQQLSDAVAGLVPPPPAAENPAPAPTASQPQPVAEAPAPATAPAPSAAPVTPSPAPSSAPTSTPSPRPSRTSEATASNASPHGEVVAHPSSSLEDRDRSEEPTWLAFSLAPEYLRRTLDYTDDIFGTLRSYKAPAALAMRAQVDCFPGALAGSGAASWFGLTAGGEWMAPLNSVTSDGTKYSTKSQSWNAGLKLRIPAGAVEVGASVLYVAHDFKLDAPSGTSPIPGVAYRGPVAGLGLTLHLGKTSLGASGSYMIVQSLGEIGSSTYFPRAKAAGANAELFVSYQVADHIGLRLAGAMRRYFYSMKPEPGDPYIAGGAIDQYLSGTGGVDITF